MLIKLITDVLSKPQPQYEGKPRFKPSDLGTPCLRKLYYSYNRVPQDYDAPPGLKKYGHAGNDAHDRIGGYLREAGVLIDYYNEDGSTPVRFGKENKEFPLKDPDLEISAMIDAVMILDGQLWLGEWKTIGLKGFRNLVAPKAEHLVQGSTYLYAFGRALKEGKYKHIKELEGFTEVAGIKFLYECRDNIDHKEFTITQASEVFKQTLNKMAAVKDAVATDALPGKTDDWCRSCPWRDKCAKNFKV